MTRPASSTLRIEHRALGIDRRRSSSAASVSAQRSATYDTERQVRLEGAVTRIEWVNPRAFLFIDVRDASGRRRQLGGGVRATRSISSGTSGRAARCASATSSRLTPCRRARTEPTGPGAIGHAQGIRQAPLRDPGGATGDQPRGARAALARWTGAFGSSPRSEGLLGNAERQSTGRIHERAGSRSTTTACSMNLADADRVAPMQPWAKAALPASAAHAAEGRPDHALHAARAVRGSS